MDDGTFKENLSGYELSRDWFDWCFEHSDEIRPTHTALYFFAIEHCNRLGWKAKFGLPTQMAMDAIGVKNWRTYSSAFEDIVNWGFFKVYKRSKNQYSATVIGIVKNTKATTRALTKAMQRHLQKQSSSIAVIDKPYNKETNKQYIAKNDFDFESSLIGIGVEKSVASDWMTVRGQKKASNTKTAFNGLIKQIELSGLSANECITTAVERSWMGFKAQWLINENNGNTGFKNKNNSGGGYESPANSDIFCGLKRD